MSSSSSPYFFVSYSREDKTMQERVVRELRGRGVNVWVDIENLIPGTPAWEREIERSIRNSAGIIVLLSPGSNDSEWVRREISFAEENDKRIFPVHIRGDENDSIPLRLSAHQRVDLRRNTEKGLDYLSDTLKNFLGVTAVNKALKQPKAASFDLSQIDLKKLALPALIVIVGLCLVGGVFAARNIISNITSQPTKVTAATPSDTDPSVTQPVVDGNGPTGKIIYTCEIKGSEVCIINADGSGWRQLTDTQFANFNANLSPDGQTAVYVVTEGNQSEIHELNITNGKSTQLTDLGQSLGSPEISPYDNYIIFHYRPDSNSNLQLWIANRDGSNPHEFYSKSGRDVHDGTWSPDGDEILFALGRNENNNLYVTDLNGRDPRLLNQSIDTRGRSDWGGGLIALDMGGSWAHDVYLMNADGSSLRRISPAGMNAQGASISPDGQWVAFTAYTDVANKDLTSCEIFIMRVDGSDMRQLTNNNYCDYQPRWGN